MSNLKIIYASEMGNAIEIAENVFSMALDNNIEVEKFEMNDVSIDDLSNMKNVIFITSTTGDGDIPLMGELFWDNLNNTKIKLSNLDYSVCALGDSSYFDFCGAGKKIDNKLRELGANCVVERHECDFDIEGWETWFNKSLKAFGFS